MPIMDGYDACYNIDNYFTQKAKPGTNLPKIYALTSDHSEDCANLISEYPFFKRLYHMTPDDIKII